MTTVEAMQQLICYIRNDGSTIADITQTSAVDLWEEIGVSFNARFNTGGSSQISTLTLTSLPGATVGTTAVTVENGETGASYRYRIGGNFPAAGEDLSTWTAWDGTSDITATDGTKLFVASVDSDNKAIACGSVIVNAKV